MTDRPTKSPPATYRFTEECVSLLTLLAQTMGLAKTDVIELAVRHLAKRELTAAQRRGITEGAKDR